MITTMQRLHSIQPMPRGRRLSQYCETHQEYNSWAPRRSPLWLTYFDCCKPSWIEDDDMPTPAMIKRWAAPLLKARQERSHLRELMILSWADERSEKKRASRYRRRALALLEIIRLVRSAGRIECALLEDELDKAKRRNKQEAEVGFLFVPPFNDVEKN